MVLFPSGNEFKGVTYDTQLKRVNATHSESNIHLRAKTHAPRTAGARMLDELGCVCVSSCMSFDPCNNIHSESSKKMWFATTSRLV